MDRNLLNGPSAYVIARYQKRLAVFAMIWCILVAAASAFKIPQSWATESAVAVAVISVLAVAATSSWAEAKARKEKRAAYTTIPFDNQELEQRDPYLGRVLREAGQEYLRAEDFRRRVEISAQEAKGRR